MKRPDIMGDLIEFQVILSPTHYKILLSRHFTLQK